MTDRSVNCYKCGGDGHYARNCPQSNPPTMQTSNRRLPPALASIAASLDISPASALNPESNAEEATVIARIVETEEIEATAETVANGGSTVIVVRIPGSATTVESQDTSPVTAGSRTRGTREVRTSATTVGSMGTSRGSVLRGEIDARTSATTAMRPDTWHATAPTSDESTSSIIDFASISIPSNSFDYTILPYK